LTTSNHGWYSSLVMLILIRIILGLDARATEAAATRDEVRARRAA
jgi:hypothetical protein